MRIPCEVLVKSEPQKPGRVSEWKLISPPSTGLDRYASGYTLQKCTSVDLVGENLKWHDQFMQLVESQLELPLDHTYAAGWTKNGKTIYKQRCPYRFPHNILFMAMANRVTLSTEPWGIPFSRVWLLDSLSPMRTLKDLFDKKFRGIRGASPSISTSARFAECHTSKWCHRHFFTGITATRCCLRTNEVEISVAKATRWSRVDRCFLKPHWIGVWVGFCTPRSRPSAGLQSVPALCKRS